MIYCMSSIGTYAHFADSRKHISFHERHHLQLKATRLSAVALLVTRITAPPVTRWGRRGSSGERRINGLDSGKWVVDLPVLNLRNDWGISCLVGGNVHNVFILVILVHRVGVDRMNQIRSIRHAIDESKRHFLILHNWAPVYSMQIPKKKGGNRGLNFLKRNPCFYA